MSGEAERLLSPPQDAVCGVVKASPASSHTRTPAGRRKKTTTKTTKGEGVSYLHNAYSAKRDGQTTTGRKRQTRQLRTYTGYVGSCSGGIKNEKNCPDTERVFRSDTYSFREWIKWDATTVIRVLKALRGKSVLWSFETRI